MSGGLISQGNSPEVATTTPAAPDWLAGGGELGRLIRELDWSQTPLGPIESWPQSLKTSVSICLASRFPIVLYWGPEYVVLYNDAYSAILGSKHPWALGQRCCDCWAEIWDTIGPMLQGVIDNAEATWSHDLLLVLQRYGYPEECYFSFSFSPVRVEAGVVGGVFTAVIETTNNIIGERRLRTLRDLAAKSVDAKTAEVAYRRAAETLSENLFDIPFAALCAVTKEGFRTLFSAGIPADHPIRSLLSRSGSAVAQKMQQAIQSDRSLEIDLASIGGELPLGAWNVPASEALLMPIPAAGPDGSPGVLVCGVSPKKKLDGSYRTFFSLITRQIATSIADARAHEEERKRAEALAEIDRAKTAFFSNVSHEFRTPLTLMLGPVEELLARSHTDLTPAAKNQLKLVNRNGTRLLRLVNTLLDFSRIEAGRMQAIYQPTDLSAFTGELAGVFRSATEKAGLRLELHCPKLKEPVYVDRGMWEKIVLNLISNAFKFTFEGKISVALTETGKAAELRISDTGVGIPAKELPRLFDRFYRIENTRSRTHEGSGIGLTLVQELVKLHGGWVRVESVLGKGSTFVVSLPLGSAHLPADQIGGPRTLATTAVGAAPYVEEALRWLPDTEDQETADELPADELIPVPCPPLATQGASTYQRPLIMVADDNADMRQYLVRLLGERYEVQAVSDGEAALAAIRQRTPALVLTDVMMPNLDGFGLLRELRSGPATRTIPIIVLSARAGEESRVEGMEHGADDYLIKPFSARELLARVQTHLEMARVRKEAENALRRRTDQFETLLNEAPIGVYLVDDNFRIRAANPPALRILGDTGDVIGLDLSELIQRRWPPQAAEEILRKFRHTLDSGLPHAEPEWVKDRRDLGIRQFYEWQINRIPLPEDRYGVVCYFRDISRQVQAREAIAESEQQLRLATEAAELGIWNWYVAEDRVTWENDRPYEIFGRTREEGPANAAEFRSAICHPDDVAGFEYALSQSIETGARFNYQGRIWRKDGTERWVEFTGQPESGSDGSTWRMLGTVLDITERKLSEETLRRHRERFDLVAQAAQVGFWFCDLPFDKLTWDRQVKEHFWLPPEADVTIDTFYQQIHPDDRERTRQAIADSNANDTPYDIEYRTVASDGREKWIRAMGRTFYDANGKPKSFDGLTLDTTELKRVEAELRQSHEDLECRVKERTEALAASLASLESEIERRKTTEYVLRELSARSLRLQDEERRRIARDLHDSTGQTLVALKLMLDSLGKVVTKVPMASDLLRQLEGLADQALQEIRVTSHLLHPPLLDEVGFCSAAQWYVEGFAQRSGVKVRLQLSDPPRLTKDEELVFFRILQESLTNVLRHSGSADVDIHVSSDKDNAILSIRDYGKGIPLDKLESFQAIGAGVGVGLGGMKQRVRNLGGHLTVTSDSNGTCILATLPLAQVEPAVAQHSGDATSGGSLPDGERKIGSDHPAPAA